MVPALEPSIQRGGHHGISEIVMGMAHRAAQVLANFLQKPLRAIFTEFKGDSFNRTSWRDRRREVPLRHEVTPRVRRHCRHLSLTANPSHLEMVDPVVLGKVRAKQEQRG